MHIITADACSRRLNVPYLTSNEFKRLSNLSFHCLYNYRAHELKADSLTTIL